MNYRPSLPSDTPVLTKLWKEVFGDTEDYIHRFLVHFGIDAGYVCETDCKIVAMAFALPTVLNFPLNSPPLKGIGDGLNTLKYIYACATHPEYRGKGIMGNLLAIIYEEACKENAAGIFLQAARPSLINYYKRLGFKEFFFREDSIYYKQDYPLNSLRLKHFNRIAPKQYKQKREQKLENNCFVNWDENFFRFVMENEIYFCEYENTIFSYKTDFNKIIVDELLGETPKEQIVLLLFKEFPDFEVVHIRSMGNDFCCGQMKWCNLSNENPQNGWFAFAME